MYIIIIIIICVRCGCYVCIICGYYLCVSDMDIIHVCQIWILLCESDVDIFRCGYYLCESDVDINYVC